MSLACSKLWTDIAIRFNDKKIGTCCKSTTFSHPGLDQIATLGGEMFTHSPEFLADRKVMTDENRLPTGCQFCTENWPSSFWHDWNEWKTREFSKSELEALPFKNFVTRVDVYLSNICNLACMYCSPEYSSTWGKILNQKKETIDLDDTWSAKAIDAFIKFLDTFGDRWLEINFIGGEPFLDPRMLSFIERVVEKRGAYGEGRTAIFVVTNLSVPSSLLERYLKIVRANPLLHWVVCPSIENVGFENSEIRDGINLELFETNLDLLLQSSAKVVFGATSSCLSVGDFSNFLEWAHKKTKSYGRTFGLEWSIASNTVTSPLGMHPGLLPNSYVDRVDEAITVFKRLYPSNSEGEKYLEYLKNLRNLIGTKRSPDEVRSAQQWFVNQGKIKKKDYFSIFPVLNEIFS